MKRSGKYPLRFALLSHPLYSHKTVPTISQEKSPCKTR